MTLTLQEACARAGLTPRQMRYRIREGEVQARKVEGRWVIEEADLPADPARARRAAERVAELRQTVEEATARQVRGLPRYSVEDVRVFRDLVTIRASVHGAGRESALVPLDDAVAAVARGVHAWGQRAKADHFVHARERACDAVAALHLQGLVEAARAIEADVLPGLSGLIRRQQAPRP